MQSFPGGKAIFVAIAVLIKARALSVYLFGNIDHSIPGDARSKQTLRCAIGDLGQVRVLPLSTAYPSGHRPWSRITPDHGRATVEDGAYIRPRCGDDATQSHACVRLRLYKLCNAYQRI